MPTHRKHPRRSAVIIGIALLAAVAAVIIRALAGGGGTLIGGAMEIPAVVGTSVPQPATVPTAAPMASSAPVRIEIPVLHVSAPVTPLGLSAAGPARAPPLANHNLAGWYDRSVTPGQDGSSVILGHVDSSTGISVFFYIKTLRPGNEIEIIRADGSTAIFTVDGVQKVTKATFPASVK